MKIPDGVNQKTLSVEAIKDKKCLILRCNKVQWIAWIIKNESYYLGYNYRCSKHINKVIPVNHSRLNRSVHQLNQLLSICMHMKYLFSIEFYNIEIFHFYLINSHLTSWFSTTNFWDTTSIRTWYVHIKGSLVVENHLVRWLLRTILYGSELHFVKSLKVDKPITAKDKDHLKWPNI